MDLMPTLLDVAGSHYPTTYRGYDITPVEGQSFAPILTGGPQHESWERTGMLFWEHIGHRAARERDWKLVSDQSSGGWELFDMSADRTETRNVAADHPAVAARLAAAYDDWKARVGVRTWTSRGYGP
jgi:arylsulfatase